MTRMAVSRRANADRGRAESGWRARRAASLSSTVAAGRAAGQSVPAASRARIRGNGALRSLDDPVALDDLSAPHGQARPPTAMAARLLRDNRLSETLVQVVDEQPRLAVGHAHDAAGLADGAVRLDQLEEADLPGAESAALAEVDSDGQARHARTVAPSGRETGGRATAWEPSDARWWTRVSTPPAPFVPIQ
jgi:hypothetical protein